MVRPSDLDQIDDALRELRARIDALNEPRLDVLSGRLAGCQQEARRLRSAGQIEHFGAARG